MHMIQFNAFLQNGHIREQSHDDLFVAHEGPNTDDENLFFSSK
jgi:hypothetical protein